MSYNLSNLLYLITIVSFVLALRFLSNPAHARRGNQIGAAGMVLAIIVTWVKVGTQSWWAMVIAMLIGGGVVIGGLLLTIAALTPDMVTTPEETARLVENYNRGLSKRLSASVPSEPRVQVSPVFGPNGGGLAARFTF